MPNIHVLRQLLLGLATLFILMCILSCQQTENKGVISIHNSSKSTLFLTIEAQKTYASLSQGQKHQNWKEWENKSYITLKGLQSVEISIPRGVYNWYTILPYKVIRGGTVTIKEGREIISTDSSQVFFDYRGKVTGAYHLNCSLKILDENSLKIKDSTFSYVVNVLSSEQYANHIQVENRTFPLNDQLKFDFRDGPIDLVTGRFLPKREEIRMKVTTKEQIVPFRTCNCVGKKIEVFDTEAPGP